LFSELLWFFSPDQFQDPEFFNITNVTNARLGLKPVSKVLQPLQAITLGQSVVLTSLVYLACSSFSKEVINQ
jgi:hypothetical protein